MRDNGSDAELLRAALGPGKDCPNLHQLEALLQGPADPALARHVAECVYCQTELRLLRIFDACEPQSEEVDAVQRIMRRMRKPSNAFSWRHSRREAWWRTIFSIPRPAYVMLAMAGVLVMVGVTMQLRRATPPVLRPLSQSPPVLRSNTITVIAPSGDILQAPSEIQWQPLAAAERYEVRLLEVDRSELWKAATAGTSIPLPPEVRSRIVPAKTLFIQVTAQDASGRVAGQSELVRFRVSLAKRTAPVGRQ